MSLVMHLINYVLIHCLWSILSAESPFALWLNLSKTDGSWAGWPTNRFRKRSEPGTVALFFHLIAFGQRWAQSEDHRTLHQQLMTRPFFGCWILVGVDRGCWIFLLGLPNAFFDPAEEAGTPLKKRGAAMEPWRGLNAQGVPSSEVPGYLSHECQAASQVSGGQSSP